MIASIHVNKENMRLAAARGFINATDGADYLVSKGMAFRNAYKVMGEIVALCIERGKTLEELPLEDYKAFSELFDKDIYKAIELEKCVSKRNSRGGTSPQSVREQISIIKKLLSE